MNIYESVASESFALNEQIARQVFDIVPERGPLVIIMDKLGNIWPSDSEALAKLDINESFFKELRAKIDDGAEPVMTQMGQCSIVATELATEQSDRGYVMIVVPKSSPESTLTSVDLVEMVLNQFGLIARLIEKNNYLYDVQMKHYRVCGQSTIASN